MGLRFSAEDVHLVLVKTFVRAELQLSGTVLKVHISNGMPDVPTPVAGLGTFEVGATGLTEAELGAKRGASVLQR